MVGGQFLVRLRQVRWGQRHDSWPRTRQVTSHLAVCCS